MLSFLLLCAVALAPQDPVPAPTPPPHPTDPVATATAALAYDPMRLPAEGGHSEPRAMTVHDAERHRDIPLRVYLPSGATPAPVILFSHGLGGSCENNPYLGRHWSARGYAVVAMQHAGSDESVWRDAKLGERMRAMQRAASLPNLLLRIDDVNAVLDQLAVWAADGQHPLHGRLDLEHVGMSGHSFGAITTQAVTGQSFPLVGARYREPRLTAALAMSPSVPSGTDGTRAFGNVSVPWFAMTGTADTSVIGNTTIEDRLAVYPALPKGIDRYGLVLDGAEHSAFGERALPGDQRQRNPNHHRVILALSTAFWDTHLRGDAAARAWLHGDGPATVLQPADRFDRAAATVVR